MEMILLMSLVLAFLYDLLIDDEIKPERRSDANSCLEKSVVQPRYATLRRKFVKLFRRSRDQAVGFRPNAAAATNP